MTTPGATAPARDWWARPRVMLPVIGVIFVLAALLTPEVETGASADSRLSAHLAGPLGARGLKETAARLGWRTVLRDDTPVPTGTPGTTIHAVLDGPVPMTPVQAHRYLEAVRAGDALLAVVGERSVLGDSLGAKHGRRGGDFIVPAEDTAGCGARADRFVPAIFANGEVRLYPLRWPRGRPAEAQAFANVRMSAENANDEVAARRRARKGPSLPSDAPAVIQETTAGFPLGLGRVMVVADPDILRNDVIRHCGWGADVHDIRALEWLSAGGASRRATIEFDEYHQGYGDGPSVIGVAGRFLATHPVGRTILQLALASLLLLLAVAPRAVPPRPRGRTERRDPLEQVSALGHAYRQVGATRTATLRLLGGVRARVERAGGMGRLRDHDAFLAHAEATDPARAEDVALVRRALAPGARGISLPEVGAALARIEAIFTTTPSHRA